MKFCETSITFAEIPNETTLCVTISNCPHRCKGCHSAYLAEDVGTDFAEVLPIIEKYKDVITCFCFMGGDAAHDEVAKWTDYIHAHYPHLKVAMYSGDDTADEILMGRLDYYKIGSWQEDRGPLNSPTTNQRMWKKTKFGFYMDITRKFRKEKHYED